MKDIASLLNTIENEKRHSDAIKLIDIMETQTGVKPILWGNIIGFGKHHYKYESGREGDTVAVGFAARKAALVLYGVVYYDQNLESVKDLGDVSIGKGCLYIKSLQNVDILILEQMIKTAFALRNNA